MGRGLPPKGSIRSVADQAARISASSMMGKVIRALASLVEEKEAQR